MSWIREITLGEATGFLQKQLEAAVERAGRVELESFVRPWGGS